MSGTLHCYVVLYVVFSWSYSSFSQGFSLLFLQEAFRFVLHALIFDVLPKTF